MPSHPDRVRRNYLPDAGCTTCGSVECAHVQRDRGHAFTWRRPSDTAAEQLRRRTSDTGITANVIEGDHHHDF